MTFNDVSLLNPDQMVRICLLLTIYLLPTCLWAQSAVFIPFGQTRSEIDHFLTDGQGYIQRSEFPSPDTILNYVNERQRVTYILNDDVLYAVEDERVYRDEEIAEEVIKACLDYLDMGEFRVRDVSHSEYDQHYATVEGDRIVELMIVEEGTRKEPVITVRLKSTSRLYGPRMEVEAYASRIVRN